MSVPDQSHGRQVGMWTMIKALIRGAAASAALVAPAGESAAIAATQGSFGATSTGSLSVSVSVPNRVRLSGLTDVAFTNQDPSVAASNAQNVCVWSNTSTRGYNVTA